MTVVVSSVDLISILKPVQCRAHMIYMNALDESIYLCFKFEFHSRNLQTDKIKALFAYPMSFTVYCAAFNVIFALCKTRLLFQLSLIRKYDSRVNNQLQLFAVMILY